MSQSIALASPSTGRTMGVRAKILLVGAIGLIGALLLAGVNLFALNRMNAVADELHSASIVEVASLSLQSEINALNAAQKEYLLAAAESGPKAVSDTDPHRKAYLDASADIQQQLAAFPTLRTDAGKAALAETKERIASFETVDKQIVALVAKGDAASMKQADDLAFGEALTAAKELDTSTNALLETAEQRVAGVEEDRNRIER